MDLIRQPVKVLRDCQAVAIPSGVPVILPQGCVVVITQAQGDSFTVNDQGRLLRIAVVDADALGKEVPLTAQSGVTGSSLEGEVNLDLVKAQLSTCYDPEIPVNIVDLGLIYHLGSEKLLDGRRIVRITMTLTAPGCPMAAVIADDIRRKVLVVPGVDLVDVKIVFDPPWSQEMMSEAARLQLGML